MQPQITWNESNKPCKALWRSESGMPPPKRVVVADDTMKADDAYRLACEGTALLWRGDFQNAKQLLQAMSRRNTRKAERSRKAPALPGEAFHLHRQAMSQRARTLAMILIPLDADYTIPLRRAPDMRQACNEAYGRGDKPSIASLRELLGLVGAHEWRKKGVEIPQLNARIHPHYGVFSPVRGEYLELVNQAPLPATELAFDIGTGTGVIAALLAQRGVQHIIATDQDPRALSCARDNLTRLGLNEQVKVVEADLFPAGKAPLIVCNPPWIPARPSSPVEHAIYDPESRMLRGFLGGLAAHLAPGGEGWLIISDIAEHLGLRSREELLALFDTAGLKVIERLDISPHHPKSADKTDPLYAARAAEITSLWRLASIS
ncbi:MAG: class I SAM-dependent methyltransferase [Gammaproteobacteria bacterium]|nr:class I SAM-dependent methyltransferase [Gammaproteobacteria bacterium]MBU1447797.1 class I SAM-dependent methyltransferase [Gammaproteobacteria bacterium]